MSSRKRGRMSYVDLFRDCHGNGEVFDRLEELRRKALTQEERNAEDEQNERTKVFWDRVYKVLDNYPKEHPQHKQVYKEYHKLGPIAFLAKYETITTP